MGVAESRCWLRRQVAACSRSGDVEEVGQFGAEVVVPVPDGVAGVQHRGDGVVRTGRAQSAIVVGPLRQCLWGLQFR